MMIQANFYPFDTTCVDGLLCHAQGRSDRFGIHIFDGSTRNRFRLYNYFQGYHLNSHDFYHKRLV